MIVYLVPTYTACCNTLRVLTIVIGFVDDAYGGCLDTKTQTNYQFKAPYSCRRHRIVTGHLSLYCLLM